MTIANEPVDLIIVRSAFSNATNVGNELISKTQKNEMYMKPYGAMVLRSTSNATVVIAEQERKM